MASPLYGFLKAERGEATRRAFSEIEAKLQSSELQIRLLLFSEGEKKEKKFFFQIEALPSSLNYSGLPEEARFFFREELSLAGFSRFKRLLEGKKPERSKAEKELRAFAKSLKNSPPKAEL